MKLVIYRDKQTKEITNWHEVDKRCTDERVQNFNNNKDCKNYVEIVELDEIAECIYKAKSTSINSFLDTLNDIQEQMNDLNYSISNAIDWCEKQIEEDKQSENKNNGN